MRSACRFSTVQIALEAGMPRKHGKPRTYLLILGGKFGGLAVGSVPDRGIEIQGAEDL